jgi:hypothetical protein
VLTVFAALSLCREARAHRLEAEYRVLPGGKVQVESWFETGDSPKGAKVRVFRADGTPLFAEAGELNEKGVFVFAYDKPEKLRVVVSAGEGHSKALTISAAELANPGNDPPGAEAAGERRYEFPITQLLAGVALLLALAAFLMSLFNARQLAELRRRGPPS